MGVCGTIKTFAPRYQGGHWNCCPRPLATVPNVIPDTEITVVLLGRGDVGRFKVRFIIAHAQDFSGSIKQL
jgi:hypothetical protein